MGRIFAFDDFELDPDQQELRRAGARTKTDGLLLRLLEVFVHSPGQLITKQELVARVWDGRAVSENALTVAVTRLRKALQHERGGRDMVLTVHGRGYRFLPAVVARDSPAPATAADHGPAQGDSRFVGRERIMRELGSALSEVCSGRTAGAAIVLTGEPGIGKTRVAEMLAREASLADIPVAWAYCRGLGDTPPLWPFAELLRDAIARLPSDIIDGTAPALRGGASSDTAPALRGGASSDTAPALRGGASLTRDPRFVALVPELARLLPELARSEAAPAPERAATEPWVKLAPKHRVFDAVTRALALAVEHTPYLLIFDDLQRADLASLELLAYFLAEVPRLRLLLLATMRSDGESTGNLQLTRVLNHRSCTRMALPALTEAQVTSYLIALFGKVDPALCRAVFEKSEGNPLFMTELARQLRESEPPDIARLRTPSVALELVRQRVADLDDAERGTLTCAAVIGRNFGLPLLQAIMGRGAVELMASLDAAVARGVLMPATDSPTEFVFTHELLRAALYEALGPAQRRGWHLRVAEALEQRAVLGPVPAADLAYHARAALPEGNLRKTVDYCIEASDAAARVYAYADAARYLQHARQALDLIEGGSQRLRFGLLLRQATYVRGYSEHEFQPLAEQLIRLAREQRNSVGLAQAAMLFDSFPGFPQLPGSRRALLESLASLPEQARCTRAALLVRLATNAPLVSHAVVSNAQLEPSLKLARRSPELGERMTARFAELCLYGGPAHKPRADAALRELQDICNEHPSTMTLPPVLLDIHRALTAVQAGDLPTMARALERSEARCREFDIELLWHVERFRAIARIDRGHTAEGRAALIELHRRALSVEPIAGTELFCAYDQSVVLAADDRGDAWERALAPDADDPPNIWAMKVRALAAAGSIDEARSALRAVPEQALARLPCDREYLGTLGALARAVLALQALDYARVVYELLLPYPEHFAVNLAFRCEGSVAQLLGMLARGLGEPAKARQHLAASITANERAGFAPCAAEARLELELC